MLCSGYDSQCLALDRLHRDFPQFGYELVGWSEIDKDAIRAHNALFPDAADRNYGDMSKIDWAGVPDFDLLTYSTPCADISSAGQQKGVAEGSGTRSSLLWFTRNAIMAKRPKYLFMENVAALVQRKFKPYFDRWVGELSRYGYTNFCKVMNATDYGVPQNRKRVFVVSVLGEDARYFFPEPFALERRLRDVLEEDVDESFYLSDERIRGLIESTLKEKEAGRGFEFEPKGADETANTLTGRCGGGQEDGQLPIDRQQARCGEHRNLALPQGKRVEPAERGTAARRGKFCNGKMKKTGGKRLETMMPQIVDKIGGGGARAFLH